MYKPFIFRIIFSTITLTIFQFYNIDLLTLIIAIFALDLLDGDIYKLISWDFNFTRTHQYQRYDKLADLITYIAVLLLYSNLFTANTFLLLILLTLWRGIGVYKYFYNNNNSILIKYFDAVNAVMIIYYLSTVKNVIANNYNIFILLGIMLKYLFEIYHHRRIYS